MKKLIVLLILATTSAFSVQSQTVDEILDNYFEIIGGKDRWKSLQSIKMKGTSAMQGMELPLTIYSKRPNLEKVEIEVQGMQIVQAYDGETAWAINPFAGNTEPARADEETNKEAAKKRFEDELIDYQKKGHTLELLDNAEVEGTDTYQMKMTKKDGDEVIYYFDTENYVPIMVKTYATAGPMKGQEVETYLSDYQEVDGLMMPMSMSQKIAGQVLMQGTMTEVELDADMDDSIFAFPTAKEGEKSEEMKDGMKKQMPEKKNN